MDTIARWLLILAFGAIILTCGYGLDQGPPVREHPAWCHISRDISASGLCKNIPGLWWAI